ncbi:MAG: MarR family winged helix-turn-helix transcriptional regulator [Pseudomonadota bacterium]
MPSPSLPDVTTTTALGPYRLDTQVGYLLRRATQRHTAIFAEKMEGRLTPTQFSALVRLAEAGPCSQNELGRRTAMDGATIKGVVDRLRSLGYVTATADTADRRRTSLDLTAEGRALVGEAVPVGAAISAETLAPLTPEEAAELIRLLALIAE